MPGLLIVGWVTREQYGVIPRTKHNEESFPVGQIKHSGHLVTSDFDTAVIFTTLLFPKNNVIHGATKVGQKVVF